MTNAARQKLLVLSEAQSLGLTITSVADLGPNTTVNSTVGGAMTALLGGTLHADTVQVFVFATQAAHHVYVQPFDGMWPMPGEHHMWLPGVWPSTTALGEHLPWTAYKDPAHTKLLKQRFGPLVKSLQWNWSVGLGKAEYPWQLQTRAAGSGYTHLTMAALGGGAGAVEQRVGVAEFHRVAQAIGGALVADPQLAEQQFMFPAQYSAVLAMASQGQLPPSRPAAQQPHDHSEALFAALASLAAPRLYVGGQLPPTLDATVRRDVVTQAAAHWPILAFADAGSNGSSGMAFTGTHAFVRDGDARVFFAWSDLVATDPVDPHGEEIGVHVANMGHLQLSVGRAAPWLGPVLQQLCTLNQPG